MNPDLNVPVVPPTSQPVWSNSHDFQEYVLTQVNPNDTISLSSYNIGIHIDTRHRVDYFVGGLCRAKRVNMLIGTNPYHAENITIHAALRGYATKYPNLEIRTGEKVHAKLLLLNLRLGWAGSLNLIHPSLHDIMVTLDATQRNLTFQYFERLWNNATPLPHVKFRK